MHVNADHGSFGKAAADVANDPSTAGAAASAGADVVYADTLPAEHENAVGADAGQPAQVCI